MQILDLEAYTFDREEEGTGSEGGTGGTGGLTGGTGGTGEATGGTGGTGGLTGGTGGTGGLTGGTGGTGGLTGGTGGAGGCPTDCGALEECGKNGYCVATLVPMPGGYSIDATQVTRSQYEAWLSKNPSTTEQIKACTWNDSYEPLKNCMLKSGVCQGPNCGNHPVTCVDWCDAYAFCKAEGKRLCGKIGGGENDYKFYKDESQSQWYAACSFGGEWAYPYGSEYDKDACNGHDTGLEMTSEVGSFPFCRTSGSGYEGVYDLSGNVWEWEDSCEATSNGPDKCRVRGGSFIYFHETLTCDWSQASPRDSCEYDTGVRCCSP